MNLKRCCAAALAALAALTASIAAAGEPIQFRGAITRDNGTITNGAPEAAANNGLPTSSVPFTVTAAPTVTASSAYASGNAVGSLQTLSSALRQQTVGGLGTAILQRVQVNFKSAQTAQTDIILFSASPSSTTVTDKSAIAIATADFDKVIGVIHVSDCTAQGTPSSCQANNLAIPVYNASGSALYAVAVTRGTPTFTATSDVSITYTFLQ